MGLHGIILHHTVPVNTNKSPKEGWIAYCALYDCLQFDILIKENVRIYSAVKPDLWHKLFFIQ